MITARIDMAHHENFARLALDETKEFSKTIDIARRMTRMDDTLIIVTSDHSHTMTYNGYSVRSGNKKSTYRIFNFLCYRF